MADLAARLRQRIERDGPLRFRDWMDVCLYDEEDGYYMRRVRKTGAGADADFATAPTLHPFMARCVAQEITAAWGRAGRPDDFAVVEFGGGEGDLAREALQALEESTPELRPTWTHIEASSHHRALQQVDEEGRLAWTSEMPDDMAGVVVAHEFIDALPAHLLEWRKGSWAEVFVTYDEEGDRFVETIGVPSRRAIEAAPKRLMEEGQRVASMVDAKAWLLDVGRRLAAGSVLIIDYGDRGKRLWTPERAGGTVRGFRRQELVADVLASPGDIDITTSVDFTGLREWGLKGGLVEASFETQEAFLVRHGALETLAEAPRTTVEGASAYLRLKNLVFNPAMASAFKVQRLDKAPQGDA